MEQKHRELRRLESLDALRGLDLLFLVALGPVMTSLSGATDAEWFHKCMWIFQHVPWEGFSPWDLIMPLFMFMSGITIPFALSRYRREADRKPLLRRLTRRVLLLWLFGMICQGNLLALNPDRIYLFTNTLQAIAVGYLVAALLFLYTSRKVQVAVAAGLLLLYWGLMQFVGVDGAGAGDYTPDGNLANWMDNAILGRFRDTATVAGGQVVVAPWYHYTWVLSSLNFAVTALTGLFAGYIAKDDLEGSRKLKLFFGIGAAMVVTGWVWSHWLPVIKTIWTSSMVMVSSGYCFLLMGVFYCWIDYKGHHTGITWLKVYGMNSIVAYMLSQVIDFSCIVRSLCHGLEQYLGDYYQVLISLGNVGMVYLILWMMYRRGIYLKV